MFENCLPRKLNWRLRIKIFFDDLEGGGHINILFVEYFKCVENSEKN